MQTPAATRGKKEQQTKATTKSNKSQWSDLPTRLTTISVGVPIVWMIWSHDVLRVLFFQAVHALCCLEFARLTGATHYWWLLPLLSSVLLCTPALLDDDALFLGSLVATCAGAQLLLFGEDGSPQQQQQQHHHSLLQCLFLLTLPFRSWLLVARRPATGFADTVNVLMTVWNTDSGALVTGRCIGNRVPIIPHAVRQRLRRYSPKKSVEGLLGGLALGVFSYCVAMPAAWKFLQARVPQALPEFHRGSPENESAWPMGLLLSLAALLGDLWESCIKRQYNIKDTGKLLPGHGGILDRFDSSLLAIVVFHVFCFNS